VFGVRWPLIAVLASGCATPGRTSVGVPDVGELTLDGTLQTQNILLQAGAGAVVGVLPHLDVEGSGAYSIGGSWNVELGLRGEIPLAARLALQIAAHWERAMWQAYQGDVYSYDATLLDDGGGDLGVVGRFGSASDAPSWGAFLSGADGLVHRLRYGIKYVRRVFDRHATSERSHLEEPRASSPASHGRQADREVRGGETCVGSDDE
jgi:hypothetical protein